MALVIKGIMILSVCFVLHCACVGYLREYVDVCVCVRTYVRACVCICVRVREDASVHMSSFLFSKASLRL